MGVKYSHGGVREVFPTASGREEQAATSEAGKQREMGPECKAGLKSHEFVAGVDFRGICHLSPVVLPQHHSRRSFVLKLALLQIFNP